MTGPPVAEIWRYPVKSMSGESLSSAVLGDHGLVGDRAFAVIAADSGKVLTAKRTHRLLAVAARWIDGEVELTLPGGQTVTSADPEAAGLLSDWLGRPVRLARPRGRELPVERYENDPGDRSSLRGFDLPAWGFVDDAPVHILNYGALRRARELYPDGAWEIRRFRPNIVLGTPDDDAAPADDPVAGSHIALGQAVVEVARPCQRCVMVTQPQHGLATDREILRTVLARFDGSLGMYAEVTRTGNVSVGDVAAPSAATGESRGRAAVPQVG